MSIEELLEQMEQYRLRREQRDYRPDWLKQFIRHSAELFEPLAHEGRVGADCRLDDRGWLVRMFLGATEVIGGPQDGHVTNPGFRIDLTLLRNMFDTIHRFEWYSVSSFSPDTRGSAAEPVRSLISIYGYVHGNHEMKLELLAVPPESVGPGMHWRTDGLLYET